MYIGNYAKTVNRCIFCKGAGCSMCGNSGVKELKHLLISEQPLQRMHLQLQQHAKVISGEVIQEGKIDNETNKRDD